MLMTLALEAQALLFQLLLAGGKIFAGLGDLSSLLPQPLGLPLQDAADMIDEDAARESQGAGRRRPLALPLGPLLRQRAALPIKLARLLRLLRVGGLEFGLLRGQLTGLRLERVLPLAHLMGESLLLPFDKLTLGAEAMGLLRQRLELRVQLAALALELRARLLERRRLCR